jgi:indolepyruvate ferredoxin oxidoreductase beta subunit
MSPFDIFLVGVGGQGILTIGEIIAEAAFRKGVPVNFYPTKGMAQRGGFVKAQLRLGRSSAGPNIPEKGADLVISTGLSETLKGVRFIKPGGEVLLFGDIWAPTEVVLGKAAYPKPEQVVERISRAGGIAFYIEPSSLPSYKSAPVPDNIYVLGAALGQTRLGQVLSSADVAAIVGNRWKKGVERNLFAFYQGLKAQPINQLWSERV